ncbi:spondin-2-like isoform X2 [Anticarsia gemmatalis]
MAAATAASENKDIYHLNIIQNDRPMEGKIHYTPDQTYVLKITTSNLTRPFKWFMMTAEDPDVDDKIYEFGAKTLDVGVLKTLDSSETRYSERCFNSVEAAKSTDKSDIEIHWVSPKQSEVKDHKVRIRVTVAENNEAWYEGENLTLVLYKDNKKSPDSPPYPPRKTCNLCSEARYEVIFNGKWSRVAHPRFYPSKPDENGYSHMIGASHGYDYYLWLQGSSAGMGIKDLAETNNTTLLEDDIIANMKEKSGTRTLIRGKRRHHPHMAKPSHALFRVDRYHHMFSIAVGMRPSPDWFLGTSRFELCTDHGWLLESERPMYPWDAGTMNGVSYESEPTLTKPVDTIERVEIGSFNKDSPFYQMNLNDLKAFAMLTVRRLDVYPLPNSECTVEGEEQQPGEVEEEPVEEGDKEDEEEPEEPVVGESRLNLNDPTSCSLSEWGSWSPCTPVDDVCGDGFRTRARYRGDRTTKHESFDYQVTQQARPLSTNCEGDQDAKLVEYQNCFVDCYKIARLQ